MRADQAHSWKARAIAILAVSVYVFILLRSTTVIALLLAPVLPFTSIGVADHPISISSSSVTPIPT